ncbi:beta-ketoacyl synthase N-terminal-like domain-containing protein [Clostridium beijerinckii]|uniref:beta-ketoacyl synthase N-terminal-like domain-containing protein n=1 Tax=Clostridium beijerinckii TaxID=1520 RepID=UPI0009CA7940|nr:beta-ketoacyl synthase N-terminal-like domain-containing protein [Clostridium beijerinckii]NRT80596.1 acyl transferase domain-containing protein/aryl carrier-like protein [Clostridium beijerinckii]OOM47517.1 polyketide synthase PksN [Clostridium beijerinckii]
MKLDLSNMNLLESQEESLSEKVKNSKDIAIIGMAIRSPGSKNTDEFWKKIKAGVESVGDIPSKRKEFNEEYLSYLGKEKGEIKFPISGYLDEIDKFDYEFFNITPKDAQLMDPNQRLFLETAWQAIEDSGYGGNRLNGSRTGVYVGFGDDSDYLDIISHVDSESMDIAKTGNLRPVVASRLSYILNLKGPNMIIDTSCSSSLVAIHTASQALKNNECDVAIAGGVKISVLPNKNNSNLGVESKTSRTRTFDDNSDGTLWGECVGVIVIKTLKNALRDNDDIYAVIKASCLNQDGKSAGITVPSQVAQENALVDTWNSANIDPSTLTYIETHGTGTRLGDPIEIRGITNAFRKFTKKNQICAIGSLKPNIGHTVHASGVASVIKVILMMNNKQIPPLTNFDVANKNINFEDTPIYVNNYLKDIDNEEFIRCGISSFGLSGTNAHMVLEKSLKTKKVDSLDINKYNVLTLSAKSKKSLENLIDKYMEKISDLKSKNMRDVCFSANVGRGHYNYRIAILFKNFDELYECLKSIKGNEIEHNLESIYTGYVKLENKKSSFNKDFKTATDIKVLTNKALELLKSNVDSEVERYNLLKEICRLYVEGANIDWKVIYKESECSNVHLPAYQFDKISCWVKVPKTITKNIYKLNVHENNEIDTNDKVMLVGRSDSKYSNTEKIICNILSKVMGFNEIDIDENLSELGGDSIVLTKIYKQLKLVLEIDLHISDIYSYPTVRKLGEYIDKNFLKKEYSLKKEHKSNENTENDIAIIGISVKLPKADSVDDYWDNLINKKECIREIGEKRKRRCDEYLKYINKYNPSATYARLGYIDGMENFDYKFFNISPKEANLMDPHQRLLLQELWKVIEDAGYSKESISSTNTGVYIGYTNDFRFNYWKMIDDVEPESYKMAVAPNLTSIMPSRISYLLDLKGPSMLIDTACSSSLVAIHTACEAIKNNECDMALAGGVRVDIMPIHNEEKNIGIESSKFKLRAFDNEASGTVWGEGVVTLMLKPLITAEKDNDHIYAVIKSSAINQDGTSAGITSPNPAAQSEVIEKCWRKANINPETIDYIECHGTGTNLGDPMEIIGITNAFKKFTNKKQFCAIGSVKSNIGHLDAVSGAASLIKAILSLQRKTILSSINFDVPNNKILFEDSPLYFANQKSEWKKELGLRRCGISSFGFSGTNCHMVLEEAPSEGNKNYEEDKLNLFTLSAKSIESLWRGIKENHKYLNKHNDINVSNLCYTCNVCRNHYKYRIGIIASNINDITNKLAEIIQYGFDKLEENQKNRIKIEDKRLIDEYINKDNAKVLEKLRVYYENGYDISWNIIYKDKKYSKVSMPTYMFEENECWIDIPSVKNEHLYTIENLINNEKIPDKLKASLKEIIQEIGNDKIEEETSINIEIHGRYDKNYTILEAKVATIWCSVLGLKEIGIFDNFYEVGGHSIAMMQIVSQINQKLKLDISYNDFNNANTIHAIAKILEKKEDITYDEYPKVICNKDDLYEKFPITDIQMSYLLGRKESFNMGGVCTHVYMEIETSFDLDRLNRSLNKVIERHPMLRAVVQDDGTQHILKEDTKFIIEVIDISDLNDYEKKRAIEKEREQMSHHVFKADRWPLIGVTALKLSEEKNYLFIGFDMLIADGSSLQIIGSDWITYYKDINASLPKIDITFRDYILGLQQFKKSKAYEEDKKYWLERLDDFPEAPKLVYKTDPTEILKPHFSRLSRVFDKNDWQKIRLLANKLNVSPSALLCTAFAEVLAYWSNQYRFAINFTIFNRYPFHKDVEKIVGDFTSIMLIEIELKSEESFFERVKNIQREVLNALGHRHYDGVEFIRKIAARDDKIGEPVMPIVFTSMLFNGEKEPWSEFGETKMGLSQTPQVYLDHQAGEIGGKLVINWDYVEEIFDNNVIKNMFEQYTGVLEYLITVEEDNNV